MHRRTKRNSILTTLILLHSSHLASSFESPPTIPTEQLTCKPTGLIQDTSCNFETIDELNRKLHTEISAAVQLPIFRYHKVDLYQECPFWAEDGLCGNRACAVDELDENDVPAFWRNSELSDLKTSSLKDIPIDMKDKCVVKEQDYCVLDGDNGMPSNGVYVDLLANPERFTGYPGKSAHRVWRAIYEDNCFDVPQRPAFSPFSTPAPSSRAGLEPLVESGTSDNETCLEKRAYYKLLSGLHTSISMHICDEYLDPATGKWVPNLQCYLNRIGLYPERLENLYFTYTLMLRALSRSASYLSSPRVELCTGDVKADSLTRQSLDRLIKIAHSYPVTFDETSMFKSDSHGHNTLKDEFKEHFRNVSRIMDCVGCDKCRLWGKLQVMGLATGLKLLFEYEEGAQDHSNFQLTRPELLGFINTLNRLSESLAAVDKFTKLWEQRSLEGTLPDQIKDEKLDGLASGKAAQAISLSPGLSSTPLSPFIGMAAKVEKKNDKKLQVKPEADSNSAPITSYSPPTTHTQSTNRSDPTTRSNIRSHVVDLALLAKPASKMFKMFSEKCKHSFALCSHWFNGLLGQMKTFIHLSRSQNGNHHYQDDHIHHDPHSRSEKKEL
ncbi:hypothetical protein MJO29_011760 [Puccinia striiformis f. sp. tritici]|uniref:hypothetical protein n=1 Tax=Puccinia striiformis f. sp. tritici TaxID=168172 RepID=UPI00200720D2|nr:hypothetical protein Pst134EA_022451 [Puccinia striiformis f. sp. tritici]KAH9454963.1 hypothetical protein Pst134EA_022451 [Puccinia striiformis f. sp. tritici]KAI7945372.1 hypothetical protein MJO29_011760 [Puccinia striiformis f. sp. tritici]